MSAKRINQLDPLSGAATSNDDEFVVFDTSANTTKRIIRSQLAEALAFDLQAFLGLITGTNIYTGSGDPTTDIGIDGDIYIDVGGGNLWRKNGSIWALSGNIRGPQGIPGPSGTAGLSKNYVFVRSETQPATPLGNGIPSGWADFPPAGALPLWTSYAWQTSDGVSSSAWSVPIRLDGTAGAVWYSGNGIPDPELGAIGDYYLNEENGDVYRKTGALTWTLIANITGPIGPVGPPLDGDFIEIVDVLPPLPDAAYPIGIIVIWSVDGRLYQNQANVWVDIVAVGVTDLTGTVRVVAVLPVLPDAEYPIGSYVLLTTDSKLYRNDANVWVEAASEVTATIQTVGVLPTLPDADYPEGAMVLLSTDGYLYQNQSNVWVAVTAPADLTGAVRTVAALPTLPDAVYPVGSYVLLSTTNKLYRNDANVWVEMFLDTVTSPAIIPVATLPVLPDAGYPPGTTVYNEANSTLYINVDDVWTVLTLTVTSAAGLPIVAGLPALPDGNYPVGMVVYNSVDGRLYKNDNNATWTAVVNTTDLAGQLQAAQIDTVAAASITGQITTTQISDSAISVNKLAANSVTAAKIVGLAITTDKLAALAISADKIAANAITTDKIDANSITAAKIQAGAIGVTQLAADSVTANKVAAGAITAGKIDAGAVTAGTIAAGAISTNQLQANAVTAVNIAANAITTEKITVGAVTATQIGVDAVTASKIFAGSVTTAKLDAFAITAEKIATNAITAGKIDTNAVTAGTIAAGAVTVDKLGADSVTAEKITTNAITAAKIQAGAVTATKINVANLSAITASTGTLTADRIRTAASGQRAEITRAGEDPVYAIWVGNGTKNDANAIFYVKHTGQAYFGGLLNSGVIKNAVQTTSLAADASVATSSFSTPGGNKLVAVSYVATGWVEVGQASDLTGNNGTVNFALDRSLNGGSTWTQIATGSGTASTSCVWNGGEPGLPAYSCSQTASGVLNFTDTNSTVSSTFAYRIRITARSLGWVAVTQTFGLTSVEG